MVVPGELGEGGVDELFLGDRRPVREKVLPVRRGGGRPMLFWVGMSNGDDVNGWDIDSSGWPVLLVVDRRNRAFIRVEVERFELELGVCTWVGVNVMSGRGVKLAFNASG